MWADFWIPQTTDEAIFGIIAMTVIAIGAFIVPFALIEIPPPSKKP